MATDLKESFEVEYIDNSRLTSRPATVTLFVRGNRCKLHVVKNSDKKCKILDEIWVDDIGALIIAAYKAKSKGKEHKCLFVFSKTAEENSRWERMMFRDKEGSMSMPSTIETLKARIAAKCLQFITFMLKDPSENSNHQLQCSLRYIAIVPEDNTNNIRTVKKGDMSAFCEEICGSIYAKGNREIALVDEHSSSTTMVRLLTSHGHVYQYKLCNGRTVEMIARELDYTVEPRDPASPLPPTPTTLLPSSNAPTLPQRSISATCGMAPRLGEKPFWLDQFVPPNPEDPMISGIYRTDAAQDLQPLIRNKMEHIQSVCRRQPSKRFNRFINDVQIEPAMLDMSEVPPRQATEHVYRRPRLSCLVKEKPRIPTSKFSQDNIESTLAECLDKVVRKNFEPSYAEEVCPLGLTSNERQRFCLRLDLVENTVGVIAWKDFASRVMQLDNDDLEMLDEFSCKYKCQVVEVVLDHWYKLYKMRSPKCLYPASKQTIIDMLKSMEKDALLYKLNWLDE